jgi:uncharacterized protein YyaL (SSP411 family)
VTETTRSPANRLAREKSPYLLQHAHNPVDWYPWGDEAFAKARDEDKPIFLSIGYSTCHWCHVMERESFESAEVAALLNQWFVPIKVDREERPDVDRVHMTAMQALGMGGGWPLNVFLTPALEPFFGGTYFPPHDLPGRIGMITLLPRVAEAWRDQRAQIEHTGTELLRALATLDAPAGDGPTHERLVDACYEQLQRFHDPVQGGFGDAPKFPSTVNLDFLNRVAHRDPSRRDTALAIVTRQLDSMAAGGIHDHLGGGFHRYATDATWLVPHFEKMLYDQALIASAFVEGFQLTGNPRYAEVARGIFAYVARDLTSPEGAFFSAEDADSEGEEGRFYVWTPDEIASLLPPEEAALFEDRYGVTPHGNFEHRTTILSEVRPVADVAARHGLDEATAAERIARANQTLLAVRGKRERPGLDDKVITAWNGLMISACARGARALGASEPAQQATRAAEFLIERMFDSGTGTLRRRWRDGEAAGTGQLDDYANLARGLIDLHQATHDPKWLELAIALTEVQNAHFWDDTNGGWFESPAGDPSIRVRMKDGFDGAEVAGNSTAAHNLQLLGVLLDRADWRAMAARTFRYYAGRLERSPTAMPRMLSAMMLADDGTRHVVVAGPRDAGETRAMIREFDRRFLPDDLLLSVDAASRDAIARIAPFTASLANGAGGVTAFVCTDYACRLPVHEPQAFGAQLDSPS